MVAVAQGRSPPLPTLGPCCRLTPPVSAPQVEVEVEGMDKAGNFIGWLHIDGANLSVLLVEHALSKVHFTAERSSYYKSLLSAEEAAKQKKEKVGCGMGLAGEEAAALSAPPLQPHAPAPRSPYDRQKWFCHPSTE